ncbi:hypothetical protein LCGC14_1273440 [marine sediment metagenome]|uniref:Uncharacterized protein n=1 Tax=marine sediment metagenome TaxID=412755 RepID=A0A0F9P0F7_9ZZZZ|nr:hypothetical protein [Pricia sp.]
MENQKQPELTMEQQLENAVAGALDWKHRYGAELTYSSEIQISLMQSQVEVRELKKQIQILNKKKDEKESDNKTSGKKTIMKRTI